MIRKKPFTSKYTYTNPTIFQANTHQVYILKKVNVLYTVFIIKKIVTITINIMIRSSTSQRNKIEVMQSKTGVQILNLQYSIGNYKK